MKASVVLSDVHLSEQHGQLAGNALCELLAAHPDSDLVLNGDIFDLTLEHADADPCAALTRILGVHSGVLEALRSHCLRQNRILLVPGNHDAALGNPAVGAHLKRLVDSKSGQLEVARWFCRIGPTHIEHGHMYDPDNAFAHPLATHDPKTEPLGTALMRRFVGPHQAFVFAHAHETTITSGLRTVFEKWGARAPVVIVDYFRTAFALCFEALLGEARLEAERREGRLALARRAQELELPTEELDALERLTAAPTHAQFSKLFFRLYFDQIFAGLAAASGGVALGLGAGISALLPLGLGGSYLGARLFRRTSLSQLDNLQKTAPLIRQGTGARLVVFGHTHDPLVEDGYVNLGSFGFARNGRPYLRLEPNGNFELARLEESKNPSTLLEASR